MLLLLGMLALVPLGCVGQQGERPRERPTLYRGSGSDQCTYTFTVSGAQLEQACQISQVEAIVANIKTEYQTVMKENAELKDALQALKKEYADMVDTVKKLDAETSTWREVVAWPKVDPRFAPENSTMIVKKQPSFVDCFEAYKRGNRKQGLYVLEPENALVPFMVYCDEDGWTVIQRRFDGSQDFHRTWNDYSGGFGQLSGEYWLGNENIHQVTAQGDYDLRVEVLGWNGKMYHSTYENFKMMGEVDDYSLSIGNMTEGNYVDVMTERNGLGFSTRDRDHDTWHAANCADYYRGGFWLQNCGHDPNRLWCEGGGCMSWGDVNIKKSVLKIRPATGAPQNSKTREGPVTQPEPEPSKPKKKKVPTATLR